MTRITRNTKPLQKPGTSDEEIDKWIAFLAALQDPKLRSRELQEYVRWLRAPRPKGKGRLANPQTSRAQVLADWEVFNAVETILIEGRATSIAEACGMLAEDRGLKKGEAPDSGLRKAYYRHTHTCFYPASSRRKQQY